MSLSRIRASVEISRPVVTVEAYGVGGIISSTQPVINVAFVLPLAKIQWVTLTVGAEVDYRGLNKFFKEFQFVSDSSFLGFQKRVFDSNATSDEHTLLVVKKNPTDPVHTVETRTVTYEKPLADVVDATDDLYGLADTDDQQTMFIAKSLPANNQHTSDVQHSAFHKPFAEVETTSDYRTGSFVKARSDATNTSETQTVTYEKPLADSVDAGDELNGSFQTDDGETMFLVKPFYDDVVKGDVQTSEVGKTAEDTFGLSDYLWPFDLGKGIEDVPVTSETYDFVTTKSLVDEALGADLAAISFQRAFRDVSNSQQEGPNSFSDYFGQDYLFGNYVSTGIPAFDFTKHRADSFITGDAQIRGVGKTLSDASVSLDALVSHVGLSKSDTGSTSEIRVYTLGKPMADTFGKSDLSVKLTEKSLSDGFGKSDRNTLAFVKTNADICLPVDFLTNSVNKLVADFVHPTDDFFGAANTDDDQTMSFVTGRSESVSMSETASRGVGKQLTDSVGKSDSGSFRMTSYCDVNYFTSDFVGITSTF